MADRDYSVFNLPKAIVNVANECVAGGVPADDVIESVANALGQLMPQHMDPEAAAALLRIEAGKIERTIPKPVRAPAEQELVDLARRSHEFINTMQVAGMDESTIVTTLANTAIERVARTRGADGAALWLRRMAAVVDANASAIETTARAH